MHNLDPFALRLWGNTGVRWYGLSYIVGFVIAYWLMRRIVTLGVSSVPARRVADLVMVIAMGTVVGGRLGYLLFYEPSMVTRFSAVFPFWQALAINKGGMASHGGVIGGVVACFYCAWRHGDRPAHILDLAAFATPLGLCIGRFANFVNGELYGRVCDPDLLWAVKFPQEMYHWLPEPYRDRALQEAADLMSPTNGGSVISHLIDAIQQGNQQVAHVLAPYISSRHPSQIYQALLEGLLVFVVLAILWMRPRKPGVVCATFLLTYGIMRCIGECFRQPDAHIIDLEMKWIGVSRGQLLSVPMIALGLLLVWHFGHKANPLTGGWLRSAQSSDPPRRRRRR